MYSYEQQKEILYDYLIESGRNAGKVFRYYL